MCILVILPVPVYFILPEWVYGQEISISSCLPALSACNTLLAVLLEPYMCFAHVGSRLTQDGVNKVMFDNFADVVVCVWALYRFLWSCSPHTAEQESLSHCNRLKELREEMKQEKSRHVANESALQVILDFFLACLHAINLYSFSG